LAGKARDVLLEGIGAYFNFKKENPVLEISLVDIKIRWQSSNLEKLILESLTPCTGGEIIEFSRKILSGGQAALPLCRPPAEVAGLVQPIIRQILLEAGRALPERLDLASAGGGVMSFLRSERWQSIFNRYRLVRQVVRLTPIVAAVWLISLILVTLRQPTQF